MLTLFVGCSSGYDASLSTANGDPVVLLTPNAGDSVELSSVAYDQFGRIESYKAIVSDGGKIYTVSVRQKEAAQHGKPAEYIADVDGSELSDKPADGAIGFSPKDIGGAVYQTGGQIEMKTEMAYDANGRPQLKRQTFTHGGRSYDIGYSNCSHDSLGRLAGYKADIQAGG